MGESLDLITTHGGDGRLLSISDGFSRLFGFRSSDVVGTYPPFPWWVPELHCWLTELFTLAVTDKSRAFADIDIPLKLQTAEGERGIWICRSEPLRDGRINFLLDRLAATEPASQRCLVDMAIELGELARVVAGVRPRLKCRVDTRSEESLSARELEVLNLLLEGNRTQQIARLLHISHHTARNHKRSIFQKLGVRSQVDLLVAYGSGG